MKTNKYLYGTAQDVPEIPRKVIIRRIELLDDNLEELLKVGIYDRDGIRINAILKAKKFWENINEL